MLIGCCGFIGSGKDTFATICKEKYGFVSYSFAASLKDMLAGLFGWDREKLEGNTIQSRKWREETDEWWSKELGFRVTPRNMMQVWGTDLVRQQFHTDFWVLCCKKKIKDLLDQGKSVIVTDCRFPNECKLIQELGGTLVCINRQIPSWYTYLFPFHINWEEYCMNLSLPEEHTKKLVIKDLEALSIHPSEWSWIFSKMDICFHNTGTLDEFKEKIEKWFTNNLH